MDLLLDPVRGMGTYTFENHFIATVRITDGRAILRMDMGLCVGIVLKALLKSSWRIHALWLAGNIDRGSCKIRMFTEVPKQASRRL